MNMQIQRRSLIKLPAALDLAAAEGLLETMRAVCRRVRGSAYGRLRQWKSLTVPCVQIILVRALPAPIDRRSSIERPSAGDTSMLFDDLGIELSRD